MSPVKPSVAASIALHLQPGDLVAVSDGAGMPSSDALAALSDAAATIGEIHLLLGWSIGPRPGLDLHAFASVRTVMGGYILRSAIRAGSVGYLPARLGSMPALLENALRPDVLLVSLVRVGNDLEFATEVGWARAAAATARSILVEERHHGGSASVASVPATERLSVVAATDEVPDVLPAPDPDETSRAIARRVAGLVTEGSAVQVGPGAIGTAVLEALDVPVRIDSGVVIDAVVDLERRGLLLGEPVAAYIAGTNALYEWSRGRSILRGVEDTHDISRLAGLRLVAVNTALEIDEVGQVNVEAVDGDPIAGIGGHADYALAASRSPGLSVIALPTRRGGRCTLVTRLTAPTSTPRSDIDVVVTERGVADLRGCPDVDRAARLRELWGVGA